MSKKNNSLPEHPNLLFIMTDQERYTKHFPDGWEENNLPNMQRLKKNGLSFTNAFTCASMCSPSRAAIFTGRYPSQTGVTKTFGVGDRFDPNPYNPTEIELNPEIPNLAKMLHKSKQYGKIHYQGKWHMSKGPDGVQQILPQQIDLYGFAGWKGPDGGQDLRIRNIGGGFVDNDANYTQEAIKFINESANDDKPWCLVLSVIMGPWGYQVSSPIKNLCMERAANRPAPMAKITVAAPVTISPPAQTRSIEVLPVAWSALILPHRSVSNSGVVSGMIGLGLLPMATTHASMGKK